MSFPSIKSKYGINKSGVEYLVRLIDKHGFNIEEINSKKDLVYQSKKNALEQCVIIKAMKYIKYMKMLVYRLKLVILGLDLKNYYKI